MGIFDQYRNSALLENSTQTNRSVWGQGNVTLTWERIGFIFKPRLVLEASTSSWVVRKLVCEDAITSFQGEFLCRKYLNFQLCSLYKIMNREGAPHIVNIVDFKMIIFAEIYYSPARWIFSTCTIGRSENSLHVEFLLSHTFGNSTKNVEKFNAEKNCI